MKIRMLKANLKSGPLKKSTLWRTEACGNSLDYRWPVSSLHALQGNIRSKSNHWRQLTLPPYIMFPFKQNRNRNKQKNLRTLPP